MKNNPFVLAFILTASTSGSNLCCEPATDETKSDIRFVVNVGTCLLLLVEDDEVVELELEEDDIIGTTKINEKKKKIEQTLLKQR